MTNYMKSFIFYEITLYKSMGLIHRLVCIGKCPKNQKLATLAAHYPFTFEKVKKLNFTLVHAEHV